MKYLANTLKILSIMTLFIVLSYSEYTFDHHGKKIYLYSQKDISKSAKSPRFIQIQDKIKMAVSKKNSHRLKTINPPVSDLDQYNFQKIVEEFAKPKVQSEYYWIKNENIPLSNKDKKMTKAEYFSHHKLTFFDENNHLKVKPEDYPSWKTCGLLFFQGPGPVIAAKQILCDICLNLAEKKGPMEEMVNFIAGVPYWKYKGSSDTQQVNEDWLRHKTVQEKRILLPYGYLAHDFNNYRGHKPDQQYENDYEGKDENKKGDWNYYLQQQTVYPLPIPLFRIEKIVDDIHEFRHNKCQDKTKDCEDFSTEQCVEFADGQKDKDNLSDQEKSKYLQLDKSWKEEKMSNIYWHVGTPVAQSYAKLEYMKIEALSSSVGSWYCADQDLGPYSPDIFPISKGTEEELDQNFEKRMKSAILNGRGCRHINSYCPYKSIKIDENSEGVSKSYADEIGLKIEKMIENFQTQDNFLFKPITGAIHFNNKITLNAKQFKKFDFIYFELIQDNKFPCSNQEGLDENQKYKTGKENNKVEQLFASDEYGFHINYKFNRPGNYRLCHQSVTYLPQQNEQDEVQEDVSKRTGVFKTALITVNAEENTDKDEKTDFSTFLAVEAGVCRINDNWIKKNDELVCVKCQGDYCREMSPPKGLTFFDMQNPFLKNFFPMARGMNKQVEDEESNDECLGEDKYDKKCANDEGVCRMRPTLVIEDNTDIQEKYRYSLIRHKIENYMADNFQGNLGCVLQSTVKNTLHLKDLEDIKLIKIKDDQEAFELSVQSKRTEGKEISIDVNLKPGLVLGPCRENFDPREEEKRSCNFDIPVDQQWGLGYKLLGFSKGQQPKMTCQPISRFQAQDTSLIIAQAWESYIQNGIQLTPAMIARQLMLFPLNKYVNKDLYQVFNYAGINISINQQTGVVYHKSEYYRSEEYYQQEKPSEQRQQKYLCQEAEISYKTVRVHEKPHQVYEFEALAHEAFEALKDRSSGLKYCEKKNIFLDMVNNQETCQYNQNSEIGYIFTINFDVSKDSHWYFRFGLDFGWGGISKFDDILQKFYYASDSQAKFWWDYDWNKAQFLNFDLDVKQGIHKLEVIGAEDCCDGKSTLQYKVGENGVWTTFGVENLNAICKKMTDQ